MQTNVVRRDGRRAVLMTVLKAEGASTISVVQRLRAAMPAIQAQLPPELKMEFLFDQSVFVQAAVEGVLREGAIAAGLTALMILLFLGSWRSTLIVATSIPLSILTSIIVLWALGQSLNIMTLGGMALAVGILVDDATVELENTHRFLGLKHPLRKAILDGAAQIAAPAFVSTICICIVFVPVVFLTGPAASLFIPLALSVIFAMLASYFLSRTLVPTMMLYLLPKEVHLYSGEEGDKETRRQGDKENKKGRLLSFVGYPFVWLAGAVWRVHEAFDRVFERLRSAYERLLGRVLGRPWLSAAAMLAFALGSLVLFPFLGQDFFPAVDAGQFRLHVRAPAGTRIEETEALFGRVEDAIRKVVPDGERSMILDNMGLTQSFTIMAYVDNGTVSDSDGEILVSLKPNHRPTADYVTRLRNELPAQFPGCTFYFMPADITSQILDFGLPAPIDVQVVGVDRPGDLAVAQKIQKEIAKLPGLADVHVQQITDRRDLQLDVDRTEAAELGLTETDVANSVLVSLSSTSQLSPNYWVNPQNRVNYRVAVQTPDYKVNSVDALMNTPIIVGPRSPHGGDRRRHERGDEHAERGEPGAAAAPEQPDEPAPHHVAAKHQPLQRPAGLRGLRQRAGPRPGHGVRRRAEGHRRGAADPAARQHHRPPRPGPEHEQLVRRAGRRPGVRGAAGLLPDGGQLPVVARPVHHPHGAAGALAGIVWMLYLTQTTVSVPALMGAIMCVGVATSNSILLVTFANEQRREGLDARSAALSAGTTRLRPVVMTALAMIVGMAADVAGAGRGRRAERPAGPGRHRRPAGGHRLHAVLRAGHVQPAPPQGPAAGDGRRRRRRRAGAGRQ